MKFFLAIQILLFPFLILLNNYFYANNLYINILLLLFELLCGIILSIKLKYFYINKLFLAFLLVFFIVSVFNGYWQLGALLNLIILIFYTSVLINSTFILEKENLIHSIFIVSIWILVVFFVFGDIFTNGAYFYQDLYYNIGLQKGFFVILDSSLTVPLLFLILLFSTGFMENTFYKYILWIIVFVSLFFLQRRGPMIISSLYLLLTLFNIKSKVLFKIIIYIPIIITFLFSIFIEDIKGVLLFIDVIESRGVEASNQERLGLLIHFFEDLNRFDFINFFIGNIETFKNINPDIVYYHPHNTLLTMLFLSGIIPVFIFVFIINKLTNELIKYNMLNQLRVLVSIYLICFLESILNNFSFFTIFVLAFLYNLFLKIQSRKHHLKNI